MEKKTHKKRGIWNKKYETLELDSDDFQQFVNIPAVQHVGQNVP
jgi:hypothetical protein